MGKKVALVLSSGGARGLIHIGVIEELEKHGYTITSVSGSSIGAFVGGMHAMGRLKEFSDWICTLNRLDVFNLMDFTLSNCGVLKANKVFKKLERNIQDVLIEDMNIPFVAMATDIVNNKEIAFTTGSFYKAIRASIAIPTIITSVDEKNRILVDGGVLNPLPISQIERKEGDILVVVNLYGFEKETIKNEQEIGENKPDDDFHIRRLLNIYNISISIKKRIVAFIPKSNEQSQGYISIINRVVGLMLQKNANNTIELNKPDIIIDIPINSAGTFEFYKAKELIQKGRTATRNSIYEYNKRNQPYFEKTSVLNSLTSNRSTE
ncbi:patatin-like phospholipase family protein [Dysgonomonas mossii]|uniref:PNPLA domain-containing protein n=1 Tax=Dysgonomonas mossii DSM 22836 TaxID=742767 RepID=F8X3W6_9BACT|nr:patatin-like phospholipase family protein [Dysgonomonas mossii]EGK05255.1 hypothetical protein HMPREF9456_02925 [Dysgonomonas mossii DSM 22836]